MASITVPYRIDHPDAIHSPGLLFFKNAIAHNIAQTIDIAGSPERLRPHVKTHKTREIACLQLAAGITKHKCATIAEAEMLALAGITDIMIAYQLLGPNQQRLARLVDTFPAVRFSTLVDATQVADSISKAIEPTGYEVELLLDLDSGMHRTGIAPGPEAIELYEYLAGLPGIRPGGLHWYDGHHREPDVTERQIAVTTDWERFTQFRNQLMLSGLPIPRVVTAGTGSFPILAQQPEPNLELSPGTTTLYDADMQERFPEQPFRCAVGILTRVVSKPTTGHLTLDVGHKACAADPPAGDRLRFPALPDAVEVKQNEEHLVIRTDQSDQYELGDTLVAIPRHACPTANAFSFATVIENGNVLDEWQIEARNRRLSI